MRLDSLIFSTGAESGASTRTVWPSTSMALSTACGVAGSLFGCGGRGEWLISGTRALRRHNSCCDKHGKGITLAQYEGHFNHARGNCRSCIRPRFMAAGSGNTRQPKLDGIGTGSYVPQLLDGGNYRTIIYVQNFGSSAESYILDLLNEDGTPASFHIAELGGTGGSLVAPCSLWRLRSFIRTARLPDLLSQVGWAQFDLNRTGFDVSVYEVIESADPITGIWTTQSMVVSNEIFVSDSDHPLILFDQTSGYVCGVAIVNVGYEPTTLLLDVVDSNGVVVGSGALTLQPSRRLNFVLTDQLPASAGIMGSVRLRNSTSGWVSSLAVMGIKATAYKSS